MEKNELGNEKDYKVFRLHQYKTLERDVFLRVDKKIPSKDVLTYFEDWILHDQVEEYIDKDWDDHGCDYGKCYIIEEDKSSCVDDNDVSYLDSIVCDVSLNEDGTLGI